MARRVELIGAGLCSVAALLWLVYVIQMGQSLIAAVGATGQPVFRLDMGALSLIFAGTAALLLGVSAGAYLHVIHGRGLGAVMLWACTGVLIADLAAFAVAGWGLLPVPVSDPLPVPLTIFTGTMIPAILPVLEVLATTFGIVAVLASVAPVAAGATVGERGYRTRGQAVPPNPA